MLGKMTALRPLGRGKCVGKANANARLGCIVRGRKCGVSQMVRAAALWPVYALPLLRYVSTLEQR